MGIETYWILNMVLYDVKLNWAKLGENAGNKYLSEDKEWSVDVILSPEQAAAWTASGVSPAVKSKDDQQVLTVRKDLVWKKSGDAKLAPKVMDQFGDDLNPLIVGNGSTANVQVSIRNWEFQGKKGQTAEITAVQVLELNEYTGNGDASEFSFAKKVEVALEDPQNNDDVVPF